METAYRGVRRLSARIDAGWANGVSFSIADCAAAPALFYADWVHLIPDGPLKAYRSRLLQHPSVARVVMRHAPTGFSFHSGHLTATSRFEYD